MLCVVKELRLPYSFVPFTVALLILLLFFTLTQIDKTGRQLYHDCRPAVGVQEGQLQGVPHRAAAEPSVSEGENYLRPSLSSCPCMWLLSARASWGNGPHISVMKEEVG